MNLFLRVVLVWLKSFYKPRIGLLDPYVTRFGVWITDQDMLRHVTNSRFYSLVDVCVIDFFLRSGVLGVLGRNKWTPVVVYKDMKFLKALRFPAKFEVRSQWLGWDDEAVVALHAFWRGETLVGEGYTVARFIDARGKGLRIDDVAAAFGAPVRPVMPGHALAALSRARKSESASLAGSSASGVA
jgi:acyl-CoA thioesterase FadM